MGPSSATHSAGRPHISSSAPASVQIKAPAGTTLRLTPVIVAATERTLGLKNEALRSSTFAHVDGRVGELLIRSELPTINLNAGSGLGCRGRSRSPRSRRLSASLDDRGFGWTRSPAGFVAGAVVVDHQFRQHISRRLLGRYPSASGPSRSRRIWPPAGSWSWDCRPEPGGGTERLVEALLRDEESPDGHVLDAEDGRGKSG
jgi:hypothetical protein